MESSGESAAPELLRLREPFPGFLALQGRTFGRRLHTTSISTLGYSTLVLLAYAFNCFSSLPSQYPGMHLRPPSYAPWTLSSHQTSSSDPKKQPRDDMNWYILQFMRPPLFESQQLFAHSSWLVMDPWVAFFLSGPSPKHWVARFCFFHVHEPSCSNCK